MPEIPEAYRELFEKPTVAHVVTINEDGTPHATPVWIDYDVGDNRVLVNTERGRRKERNLARDPRVALSMTDPDDPYRFLSITGEVDELTTENARAHIDTLAHRYMGEDYPNPIQTERVLVRIEPTEIITG